MTLREKLLGSTSLPAHIVEHCAAPHASGGDFIAMVGAEHALKLMSETWRTASKIPSSGT